ncbi:hypothetical protein ACF8ED_11365, partial [Pseudomonas sp. zbq_17]
MISWPYTIAAATAFAGKPAPTLVGDGCLTRIGTARCGRGFTREEAGPAGKISWPFTIAAATAFVGKPAPTLVGDGYLTRIGTARCGRGFTREEA